MSLTVYDAVSRYAHEQTDEMRPMVEQLIVDANGNPSMTIFLDRARAVYLSWLIEQHDGNRAEIAEVLGCTVTNVNKMIARLQRKYG